MEITRNNLLSLIKSGMERHAFNITALEREAGIPKDTIRDFLRGKTQILRADKLQKVLAVLEPSRKVAITGIAGAGGEIALLPPEKDPEEVECPPGIEPSEVMALRVQGDALAPVLHEGVVYYTTNHDILVSTITDGWQVPYARQSKKSAAQKPNMANAANHYSLSALMGKPCIIRLKDGRSFLRTLKPGTKDKRYHLISYNSPDIKDAEVESVAKIIFIKPE